jgi:hypothetical protein
MEDQNRVAAGESIANTPAKKRSHVKIGWICLVLGIVLMLISAQFFPLFAPLALAALILSIIAMAKGNKKGGVILLAAVVVLGPIFFFVNMGAMKEERGTSLMDDISCERLMNKPKSELSMKESQKLMGCMQKQYSFD